MSVRTEADEKKDSALDSLRDARKDLLKCVDHEVWGGDEWNSEYEAKIFETITTLTKLINDLS